MKKLKPMQKYPCKWCYGNPGVERPLPAVWRSHDWRLKSCDNHKNELQAYDKRAAEQEQRYTEGDHQSWGQL